MVYFSYFVKCIIRNIAYRLCKPKILLTIFSFVAILFALHSTGYCTEPTAENQEVIIENIFSVLDELNLIFDTSFEQLELEKDMYDQMLYYSQELHAIRVGISQTNNLVGSTNEELAKITAKLTDIYNGYADIIYSINAGNTAIIDEIKYQTSQLSYRLDLLNTALSALSNIQSSIDQGNQLQEEQNQLQQEQNDFLNQETTDSDVSIDDFNDVESNDITSSGLTGIFNSIYNSISSWSSKDIVLPVPFTDKSIRIQANYTNNMLNSVGGQTLINIVSTIYYFLVARFIIYSITGIINSIKSGSILETDTKTNITTDML